MPDEPRGIVVNDRNRRIVLLALQAGRRHGLRAAYEELDRLADELAATRAERDYLRRRFAMTREIIERTDAIEAMRERCDGRATLH
jgi:hypothetical protein